jgi:hypothetical protein
MRRTFSVGFGVAVLAAVAGVSHGQQAVQWRVQDGGNGHWYQLIISGPITWSNAKVACEEAGGHLVTPRSSGEEAMLISISNRAQNPTAWVNDFGGNAGGPWLGAFQPKDASPAQPWAWVSGEPWDWTGWAPGEPNGGFGPEVSVSAMLGWANSNVYRGWADAGVTDYPPYPLPPSYVVEWSADCNGDGIVDYGQCRDGSLPDYNGNNTPDCCEAGVPCVVGNYPVQWHQDEGGNGHWYSVQPTQVGWSAARASSSKLGGDLVTTTSAEELAFVVQLVSPQSANGFYCWLGGFQPAKSCEPLCDWRWVSGEPWVFNAWAAGEPNDFAASEDFLTLLPDGKWYDIGPSHPSMFVVEWSADCDGNGVVDYGEILDGTLADGNSDGVPDVCQCPTDLNGDGATGGADISVLLGFWGLSGKSVLGDIDGNLVVDAADLSALLASWGPCP